jgi:acyl-CoA hydrolase
MQPKTLVIHHLVKGEDLNHHRTLFAGRGAEWLVESGFIAAADLLPPQFVVCVKVHGMAFTRPVQPGEIVRFESKIILTGRSRLVAHVQAFVKEQAVVSGFITFVYVDETGKSCPHGIVIEPVSQEDKQLHTEAQGLH